MIHMYIEIYFNEFVYVLVEFVDYESIIICCFCAYLYRYKDNYFWYGWVISTTCLFLVIFRTKYCKKKNICIFEIFETQRV